PVLDVDFGPDVPTAGQSVTFFFKTALQDPVPPTTTLTIQFTSGGKPLEIWALPSDEGQTQYMFNKTVLVPDQLPASFKIRVDLLDVISNTHYACVVFTRP
ncbi:270_t:CDS:1, partial [Scutellospora calospora]